MRDAEFDKIAKALADPNRRRILREIQRERQMTCTEVCGCSTLSQPTISHHIKTLEAAGLISIRKSGQFHILTANTDVLQEFARDVVSPSIEPQQRPTKVRSGRAKS